MLESYFSANTRNALRDKGFTQADLAEGIGLTVRAVSKKLNGTSHWTGDQMDAVSVFLGVSLLTLFRPVPAAKRGAA